MTSSSAVVSEERCDLLRQCWQEEHDELCAQHPRGWKEGATPRTTNFATHGSRHVSDQEERQGGVQTEGRPKRQPRLPARLAGPECA